MKFLLPFILFSLAVGSCVPSKKYKDLLEKEQKCSEELSKYKTDALNFESEASNFKSKALLLEKEVKQLKADTSNLGLQHRNLLAKYDKMVQINEALEVNYDKLRLTGAKETAMLSSELEAKQIELQNKQDELTKLETELRIREQKLEAQEKKLEELNEVLRQKEEATKILKDRVSSALKNFENKGLTVVEKDGKIYVSLEAQLLFKSGSTFVEENGKKALVELAKVLESEKELEIIVEGHTDTDAMNSASHPKNNWELSVLRATSVISIMTTNSKMNPGQIMAAGRSEFHPVDPNDKAKNRRIEVIISPDLDALYTLLKD